MQVDPCYWHRQAEFFGYKLIPNIMTVHFNMFSSPMKNKVGWDMESSLVVTIECHWCQWLSPRSLSNVKSHKISQQVEAIALYSASADERATTDCFFTFQEIGELPNNMQNPVVDFLESQQLPQSESQYPVRLQFEKLANKIPWSDVPLRYLRICLAAAKWSSVGSCIHWLNT